MTLKLLKTFLLKCKVVPFPDPDTGLIYLPENENSISFTSDFLVYNPKLRYTMNFPGVEFCGDNGGIMLLVGSFPAVSKKEIFRHLIHFIFIEKEKTLGNYFCNRRN